MKYQKPDLSYFSDPKNGSWYQMPAFPMTPISDAECRILFESIGQMPMPYELEVYYRLPKVSEKKMSRVEYLDFLYNQREFYLNRVAKEGVSLKFTFSESYVKNGGVIDKRLVKCARLMKESGCSTYPFSTILRGTYSGFYGCGGIGSKAYFNGGVSESDYGYKHNPDKVLNRMLAMHWDATYKGELPNVVRRQFLNKVSKVLKIKALPVYHDQLGKLQTAPVVNLKYKTEIIKDFLLNALFDINVENFTEYNVE